LYFPAANPFSELYMKTRTSILFLGVFFVGTAAGIAEVDTSSEARARIDSESFALRPGTRKISNIIEEGSSLEQKRQVIADEVRQYMGSMFLDSIESVEPETPALIPSSANAQSATPPNRFRVVATTKDEHRVTLRVIESKGSFAVMPE
jgi:hypothetical protein